MKIIRIFVDNFEGLHSIHYDNERYNEFYRLFDAWNDYEYLLNFCKENQQDIFTEFWGVSKLEEFVEMILDEAYQLEQMFLSFYENGFSTNSGYLQSIFRPLKNFEITISPLQPSKAKVDDHRYFKKPKLRLYALRLDKNTFILTGGCIKLVQRMAESKHTNIELTKLQQVKEYLSIKGIKTLDDIAYYYEQGE